MRIRAGEVASNCATMSNKITVSQVTEVLNKNEIEPATKRKIIEDLNLAAQPDSAEEKPPAVKKQFVVLVSDPEGKLPSSSEFTAWVLQIPEADSVATAPDRIIDAACRYNATRKGQQFPVRTVGEAIENLPAYFFKEQDVWVKTKTPALVNKTSNAIPRETTMREVPVIGTANAGEKVARKFVDAIRSAGASVTISSPGHNGVRIDAEGIHKIPAA